MLPLGSFTIGLRAHTSKSWLRYPCRRHALNSADNFSKKMLGAAFKQSEVKFPETSDLSGFSFLTAVFRKSAVTNATVSLASAASFSTLSLIWDG